MNHDTPKWHGWATPEQVRQMMVEMQEWLDDKVNKLPEEYYYVGVWSKQWNKPGLFNIVSAEISDSNSEDDGNYEKYYVLPYILEEELANDNVEEIKSDRIQKAKKTIFKVVKNYNDSKVFIDGGRLIDVQTPYIYNQQTDKWEKLDEVIK